MAGEARRSEGQNQVGIVGSRENDSLEVKGRWPERVERSYTVRLFAWNAFHITAGRLRRLGEQ